MSVNVHVTISSSEQSVLASSHDFSLNFLIIVCFAPGVALIHLMIASNDSRIALIYCGVSFPEDEAVIIMKIVAKHQYA